MQEYIIKEPIKDFKFINSDFVSKGSREKRFIKDNEGNEAFFKYSFKHERW